MFTLLEWIGALSGIAGALLLAVNIKSSPWAYPLFLTSNIVLAVWAWLGNSNGVFLMQAVMAAISALGIYRWLIHPAYYRKP
jgi:nicotinamide riboside transporter PnuC